MLWLLHFQVCLTGKNNAVIVVFVCLLDYSLATYTDGFIYKEAHFGQGTGPVVFSLLECVGTETDLADCPSEGEQHLQRRVHSNDVGVSCMQPG